MSVFFFSIFRTLLTRQMWVSSSVLGFSRAIEAIAMERVRKHIKKVSFEVKICGFHEFVSEVSETTRATNWIRTVKC